MDVYVSKKDSNIKAELLSVEEGKVSIKIISGKDVGVEKQFSEVTLKRWWKFLENVKPKEEKSKKSKCVKQKQKKYGEEISLVRQFLSENRFYSSVNCYKIMRNGKPFAEVYPQRKKLMCYFKSLEELDLIKTIFSKDGYNYYLPARVDISYETDYLNTLKEFLGSK
jgi:hypothetical protein